MASLNEFLQSNPELQEPLDIPASVTPSSVGTVTLTGILVSAGDDIVTFAHLGHRFDVQPDDVVAVESSSAAVPNPFGRGATAALTLKLTARLRPHGAVLAKSLSEGVPFAIERPSEIPDNSYPHHTAAELAWLAANGIATSDSAVLSSTSGTYCGHNTTSPKWSGTYSNGREDDGKSDEYQGDDATHDDTGADD